MGFGKTLREAREAKGYTVAQLAEITHIMSHTITGLENEDFSTIAAPIYGRGFVKLCCQALGLDPKPMIDEFMAIFNGEPAQVTPEPPVVPEPPIASTPEPQVAPQPPAFELDAPPEPPKPVTSRYAPPQPDDEISAAKQLSLPSIPWRLIVLILGVVAILWTLIAGVKVLFKSLSTPSENEPAAVTEKAVTTDAAKATAVTQPKVPRTPKPVKPLYID